MSIRESRHGRTNPLLLLAGTSALILCVLGYFLFRGMEAPSADAGTEVNRLFMFCAAGMRPPVEVIAAEYEKAYGVHVELLYGGSNTLLSQMEISNVGDLYLAADESYTQLAQQKGLVVEELPIALMRPVIAVASGNPKQIRSVEDLLRSDVRVALGNPDQAAVGKAARELLGESGHWLALENHVRDSGVFKPTVNEVANDVKLGSVDAGIIWDSTAAQYPDIEAIRTPELDKGSARITLAVMASSKAPTTALRFARFLAARDRGNKTFAAFGYEPIVGDVWAKVPELTFFAGSVNRRALAPIIDAFQRREGVVVNTVYNGCGILTASMRSMLEKNQKSGFPDMYMACDVYYLDAVRELFQDAVNVSNTGIVIVVQKGNPKRINTLADLARPGTRVALGHSEQCTIGVLSRRLLEKEGVYERLKPNIVTETATSALLVPNITTGSADAVLAYASDTLAEKDKLDVVAIDSPLAKAVQPYSIARSSDFKYLGRRLFQTIAHSRSSFEKAGFVWQLDASDTTGTTQTERKTD